MIELDCFVCGSIAFEFLERLRTDPGKRFALSAGLLLSHWTVGDAGLSAVRHGVLARRASREFDEGW